MKYEILIDLSQKRLNLESRTQERIFVHTRAENKTPAALFNTAAESLFVRRIYSLWSHTQTHYILCSAGVYFNCE